MNLYAFTGRIGRDSETRYTQGGMAICNFTVAVDYGFGDNKGTNWIRCSLFGKRAEGKLPQYLVKGAQIAVSGDLRVREYEDKEGNKRTSVEVNVNTLGLIGSKQDSGAKNTNHAPQQRQQQAPAQQQSNQAPFAPQRGDNHPYSPNKSEPVEDDIPF